MQKAPLLLFNLSPRTWSGLKVIIAAVKTGEEARNLLFEWSQSELKQKIQSRLPNFIERKIERKIESSIDKISAKP